MNKKVLFLMSLIIVLIVSLGPIFAADSTNYTVDSNTSTNLETHQNTLENNNLESNNQNNNLDTIQNLNKDINPPVKDNENPKTITVDGSSENQMDNPTIQNAIDSANNGDTILITGNNYVHVHIIVNKTLNIISQSGTKMSACPSHTTGSGSIGIFYISPEAFGTLISGFTLINNGINDESYSVLPYGIYAKSVDNVIIENCNISSNSGNGISAVNGNNFKINNVNLTSSKNGILLENMNNISILNSFITKCTVGTNISYNCRDILVNNSNISSNKLFGINLESADNVNITNNYIMYNRDGSTLQTSTIGSGILVNSNVSSLNVKGNYIVQNGIYGLLNTYKVKNLDGYNEVIDNNIFINNGAGSSARSVYTSRFIYSKNQGDYIYNEENDTYTYVGMGNGNYTTASNTIYVWHNLFLAETMCGATVTVGKDFYDTNENLVMSSVKQIKPGVYEINFYTKSTGEIAKDLNTPEIIFYLNKNNTNAEPVNGDVYRKVRIVNGVAIADFTNESYYKTNNVLTVLGPGVTKTTKPAVTRLSETYNIPDDSVLNVKKCILDIDIDDKSNVIVKVIDEDGKIVSNDNITYLVNNTPSNKIFTTDSNGEVIISDLRGSMNLTVVYVGNKYDTSNSSVIFVSLYNERKSTIIEYKNMTQKAVDFYNGERGGYFNTVLKDQDGNVLANKSVSIGFNGVVYNLVTDENGVAKLQINLAYAGIYTFAICFLGDDDYNGSFEVAKITINKKVSYLTLTGNTTAKVNVYKTLKITLTAQSATNPLKKIAVANKKVTVTVNGVTYTGTTNAQGVATVKIKINKAGTYIITTRFVGNPTYEATQITSRIVVKN
ncbi:hypothetical protein BGI41_03630 [Methanobrevibacter sp. 87.7]|uniref:right-handed parallel beta-helix repeat-containing protein n=1 Tax=Methanobrevibacter sp. 87.7 TaxID=387957 RepID=UPI000B4FEAF8|nr:right-handed parallel beta-helix repeat-containing protein [Methanobrevibacter sp. 87.7]OWT33202.1 hypothetical protein BGI41_03630 [Methanobrevibacter sp. 87.7]